MCNVKERIRQTDTADDADRDGDGAPPPGEGRGQRFGQPAVAAVY